MSDGEINKLLIITPQRPKKHDGFDRTSNSVSRVKMSQDMASAINDGLYNYEDELWEPSDEEQWIETPGSNSKHVEVISREEMERLRPEPVPHQNPPSPPELPDDEEENGNGKPCTPGKPRRGKEAARFYPVTKEPKEVAEGEERKRKTRHGSNPPVESHVGWIMDKRLPRGRLPSLSEDQGEDSRLFNIQKFPNTTLNATDFFKLQRGQQRRDDSTVFAGVPPPFTLSSQGERLHTTPIH